MTLVRFTGLVLIVLPVAFNVLFFLLGRAFDYPGILRRPVDEILSRFQAGGSRLVALWYGFALTALLAIPMALLVYAVFAVEFPQLAVASAIVGALSGLVQALGLLRWPLLVPLLASQYHAPSASPSQRDAISVVFNAFHQYAGVIIGEHLGYLFTAGWTILVSVMLIASPSFGAWIGLLGIASAAGILTGLLEPAGWKPAGAINAISYLVWSAWLLLTGVLLIAS